MMQVVGALSQKAEPNAVVELEPMDGQTFLVTGLQWFCFAVVIISLLAIVFCMVGDTSASESEENSESRRRRYLFSSLDEVSDPDEWMALNHHDYSSSSRESEPEVETDAAGPRVETPLQFGMYHVYLFMQGCFQRLRHLMATDHSMQRRGWAILHKNKWNLGKTCFLQHLRCCVVKQSLVQFPCGFAIFCWSVFTCIFDALKSIGALQDDIYILVHPGLRVGGWECSVGQAAEWGFKMFKVVHVCRTATFFSAFILERLSFLFVWQ